MPFGHLRIEAYSPPVVQRCPTAPSWYLPLRISPTTIHCDTRALVRHGLLEHPLRMDAPRQQLQRFHDPLSDRCESPCPAATQTNDRRSRFSASSRSTRPHLVWSVPCAVGHPPRRPPTRPPWADDRPTPLARRPVVQPAAKIVGRRSRPA